MTKRRWILLFTVTLIVTGIACNGKHSTAPTVVVYVSEDQVFAEPILKDFEKETGIEVRAVYDTEEAKSTGVMNRLLAEKDNPQADVYWANEPMRAAVLQQRGIAAPYISPNAAEIPATFKDASGYWTGFSARARILLVNKSVKDGPHSVLAYTEPRWKNKGVVANPLFGTTTAEMAALFTIWGDDRGKAFLQETKKNGVRISTSNGESADFVASGESEFGLVDSDDAFNRIQQGRPVEAVYPDQQEGGIGVLIVPNAVVAIQRGPHATQAHKLVDFLLSRETERKLAYANCAQIPLHPGVDTPPHVPHIEKLKIMSVNYAEVAAKMQQIQPFLKEWVGY
ncbi:MAG: extracellular solute-binding protein [Acidobacteriales bacterium]|nr:extracellular solute-binding protein [Terriglobales bacterium]